MTDIRDLLQVQAPSEIRKWFSIFVYADSGVGKTELIGTAQDHPDTSPVLIFDVEGGTATLRHRSDIDVVRVHSLSELKKKFNELSKTMDTEPYYKTVALDSVTELCSLDIRDIMKETYDRKPETTDIDVPSPREWGKSGNHIREIVRKFRELPCHTIFTALADQEAEDGQPTKIFPKFHGKTSRLRPEIPGFLDVIGYMYVDMKGGKEPIRKIQFAKSNRVVAKDRLKVFGNELTNPTIPTMWDLIRKDGNATDS